MSTHTAKKQKTGTGNTVTASVKGVGNAAVKQTEQVIYGVGQAFQSVIAPFALGQPAHKGVKGVKRKVKGQHGGRKTRRVSKKTRKTRRNRRITRRRR